VYRFPLLAFGMSPSPLNLRSEDVSLALKLQMYIPEIAESNLDKFTVYLDCDPSRLPFDTPGKFQKKNPKTSFYQFLPHPSPFICHVKSTVQLHAVEL
jgi:hypothetical protein